MTISVLQERSTNTAGTVSSLALAYNSAITAGSALHTIGTWDDAPGTTLGGIFTDNNSGSYRTTTQVDDPVEDVIIGHSSCGNHASGATTVTLAFAGGVSDDFVGLWIKEIGGAATSASDGHNETIPTFGTTASISATNANQPALISALGFIDGNLATPTATSGTSGITGWDFGAGFNLAVSSSQRITSTGSQSATFGGGGPSHWAAAIEIFDESTGGTTYNVSVSDSGAAADALATALTAINTITAAGVAADALASVWSGSNALTESGSASDAITGGLALPNSITEAASAADAVTGTPAYLNTVAEAGSAMDALTNSLTAANSVAEAGSAADALSAVLIAVNSISEAASAADQVSNGNIYLLTIAESGSAADVLANALTAQGAVTEAGSATDALIPGGSFSALIAETLNATDTIATDGTASVPAGKHRKRYGVVDGWRLLLFDTRSDADAFKAAAKQAKAPAENVLKRIRTVTPVQVINLPELKRSLPPPQAARVDQMLKERRYEQVALLPSIAAQYDAQRREAEEVEMVTHVVNAHREDTIQRIQAIHEALTTLRALRKSRRLQ